MLSVPTTCPKLKHKCSGGKKDNLALHAWHTADLGHHICTHSISLSVVCEEKEKKLCYFFHSHLPSEIQLLWPHFHALPNGNISISLLTLKSCIIYSTQRVRQCKVPSTNSLGAHTPSQTSAQTTCSDLRYHHEEIRSEIPVQSPRNKQVAQDRAGQELVSKCRKKTEELLSPILKPGQKWSHRETPTLVVLQSSSLLSSIHTTVPCACLYSRDWNSDCWKHWE